MSTVRQEQDNPDPLPSGLKSFGNAMVVLFTSVIGGVYLLSFTSGLFTFGIIGLASMVLSGLSCRALQISRILSIFVAGFVGSLVFLIILNWTQGI